jgi:transposase
VPWPDKDNAPDNRRPITVHLQQKNRYRYFVSETKPGFKVLPRRWVVERTFGWMTRWRRQVKKWVANPWDQPIRPIR